MHNPELILKNETHKVRWDFEIQTNHIITARRPDLMTVNEKKRTYRIADFAVPADHRVRLKESKKRVPGPCKGTEKIYKTGKKRYYQL